MSNTTNDPLADGEETPASSTYNAIPYPNHCYRETHPDRLAAIATLFGMAPPDVRRCRVLDIGCGDGSNIIPMAVALPDSEFIGIDVASKPLENAGALIQRAGLKNVRVEQRDLMDVNHAFGSFDYIIAHGFYSWVPAQVSAKLLEVCGTNLTANGIAFISYNTYPGAYVRLPSRDLMRFHNRMTMATEPVNNGKHVLKLLADSLSGNSLWKSILSSECDRLSKRAENSVYHDELSQSGYAPVYFADFIRSAAAYGLQFLGEAMLIDNFSDSSPNISSELEAFARGDLITYQQYLDFLTFRSFRRSLLCRENILLDRRGPERRLSTLYVASHLRLTTQTKDEAAFASDRSSGSMKTNNHLTIAALKRLEAQWPAAERFDVLVQSAAIESDREQSNDAFVTLAEHIFQLAANSLVDVRTYNAFMRSTDRPVSSILARIQAKSGSRISTMLHTELEMPDRGARDLLQLLDGTRNRSDLAEVLARRYRSLSRQQLLQQIDGQLSGFARHGLLTEMSSVPDVGGMREPAGKSSNEFEGGLTL
jgi:methyltransferase-like protein